MLVHSPDAHHSLAKLKSGAEFMLGLPCGCRGPQTGAIPYWLLGSWRGPEVKPRHLMQDAGVPGSSPTARSSACLLLCRHFDISWNLSARFILNISVAVDSSGGTWSVESSLIVSVNELGPRERCIALFF